MKKNYWKNFILALVLMLCFVPSLTLRAEEGGGENSGLSDEEKQQIVDDAAAAAEQAAEEAGKKAGKKAAEDAIEDALPEIFGTVTISGNAQYGHVLEAVVKVGNYDAGTIYYSWLRVFKEPGKENSTEIEVGTKKKYTIQKKDVGCRLVCNVTSKNTRGKINDGTDDATNGSRTVQRGEFVYPPEEFKMSYNLTINDAGESKYTVYIPKVQGCEYSFDGVKWSDEENTLKDVASGITVTGYMRYKNTEYLYGDKVTMSTIDLPLVTEKPAYKDNPGAASKTQQAALRASVKAEQQKKADKAVGRKETKTEASAPTESGNKAAGGKAAGEAEAVSEDAAAAAEAAAGEETGGAGEGTGGAGEGAGGAGEGAGAAGEGIGEGTGAGGTGEGAGEGAGGEGTGAAGEGGEGIEENGFDSTEESEEDLLGRSRGYLTPEERALEDKRLAFEEKENNAKAITESQDDFKYSFVIMAIIALIVVFLGFLFLILKGKSE